MSTIRNKGTYRLIMDIIDGGDEIVIDKYIIDKLPRKGGQEHGEDHAQNKTE